MSYSRKKSEDAGIAIKLHKIMNLASNSSSLSSCVIFKIFKDESKIKIKKESSTAKGINPEFEEVIWIPLENLDNFLYVEIYSKAGLFKSSQFFGCTKINLSKLYLNELKEFELELQRVPKGTIYFSVTTFNIGDRKDGNKLLNENPTIQMRKRQSMEIQEKPIVKSTRKSLGEIEDDIFHIESDKKTIEDDYNPEEDLNEKKNQSKENRYEIIKKIGKGGMGTVFLATDKRNNEEIALKKVQIDDGNSLNDSLKEVVLMQRIHHENLVEFKDYFVSGDLKKLSFVMEFYKNGDLSQYLSKAQKKKEILNEELIKDFMTQMIKGVQCLHQKNLVHRDLKPGNIFMTKNCKLLKIGDFGLMKDTTHSVAKTFAGTQNYMACEYFEDGEGKIFGKEGDIWSLGCIFFELCTLELKNPMYIELFKSGEFAFVEWIVSEIYSRDFKSNLILNIILHTLQKNPSDRPDINDLLDMIEGRKTSEFSNRKSSITNVIEKSKELVQLNRISNITRDVKMTSKNMLNDGLSLLGIQNDENEESKSSNIISDSLSLFGFQKQDNEKEEEKKSITSFFW
eukprot:gene6265-10272_t